MFPCSKFAFWDATETFSNSLTGNAIWKCFWHRVYTNARDWRQCSPKLFFSREIKCSPVWISLSKVTSTNDSYHSPIFHTTESSQSLSKWFKQRETTYLWIANLDELLALLQVNRASTLRAMLEYSYVSHELSLRFRYFRCVECKPENTSATIWTMNETIPKPRGKLELNSTVKETCPKQKK